MTTRRLLTWREIADRLGVSLSTVKRLHADDPAFPRRVQIAPRRVGFDADAFDEYLARLIAASTGKAA